MWVTHRNRPTYYIIYISEVKMQKVYSIKKRCFLFAMRRVLYAVFRRGWNPWPSGDMHVPQYVAIPTLREVATKDTQLLTQLSITCLRCECRWLLLKILRCWYLKQVDKIRNVVQLRNKAIIHYFLVLMKLTCCRKRHTEKSYLKVKLKSSLPLNKYYATKTYEEVRYGSTHSYCLYWEQSEW
jgi:hypothetical protein